jgi:hypothetical protein
MKIHIRIIDFELKHHFQHQFLTAWTNQKRVIYKLENNSPSIVMDTACASNIPLGLVIGAYGVRSVDGHNIYHPCGSVLIDMSKVPTDTDYTVTTDLRDHTSPNPYMGKLIFKVLWKSLILPPNIPRIVDIGKKMNTAAEKNLTYIAPWGSQGLKPTNPSLSRIHSPYYTSNIGVCMPSGAFTLELGTSAPSKECLSSHLDRLLTTLKCCNMTRKQFLFLTDKLCNGEVDVETKNVCVIVGKLFTMHTNQVMKYVSDIQFNGAKTLPTDRWECPRDFDSNFVGDCEDCAKEIMVEIHEWQHFVSDHELVTAVQKILKLYVPVICQGCVDLGDRVPKNHIWAALVPEPQFVYALGDKTFKTTSGFEERTLPTILLEGTAETHPIWTPVPNKKHMDDIRRKLHYQEPIFGDLNEYDVDHTKFYKYVIACMTPRWKDKGFLDYVYINKSMRCNDVTYGIPFDHWLRGRYRQVPATQHSEQTIRMMGHICSYDKPITPLKYNTKIIASEGEAKAAGTSDTNLMYGYRMYERHDPLHNQVCDAIERLRANGWDIFGNVIDHGSCYWVDWVIENRMEVKKTPPLFML